MVDAAIVSSFFGIFPLLIYLVLNAFTTGNPFWRVLGIRIGTAFGGSEGVKRGNIDENRIGHSKPPGTPCKEFVQSADGRGYRTYTRTTFLILLMG